MTPVLSLWFKQCDDLEKKVNDVTNRVRPTMGRIVDKLEYRLREGVARLNFAATVGRDDTFMARKMHLKNTEKNLNI